MMNAACLQTGGGLVAVVRGTEGPLLESSIKEQLEKEKKVLSGEAERTVVSCLFVARLLWDTLL